MAEIENLTDMVMESTKIDDNCIALTETKLTVFINSTVLINIELRIVLTVIL